MKCFICGCQIKDDWNFCPECKNQINKNVDLNVFDELKIKPIEGFCYKCAYQLEKKWIYCPRCSTIKDFSEKNKKTIDKQKIKEGQYTTDTPLNILLVVDTIFCFASFFSSIKNESYFLIPLFLFRPLISKVLLEIAHDTNFKFRFKLLTFIPYLIPLIYYSFFSVDYDGSSGLIFLFYAFLNVFYLLIHGAYAIFAFILICLSKKRIKK